MRNIIMTSCVIAALFLGFSALSEPAAGAPEKAASEDALIAVVKSNAPLKEKADACRELGRVGTAKAVPALVALLPDEKLSHMARYALEPIPDPAVDAALRAALGELKGRPLVGVIGSIGMRRDTAATASLAALLTATDAEVAQAAARSLGRFGTTPAAEQLEKALANAPAGNRLAFAEGLLRCAEAFAQSGKRAEAIAIYDRLRKLEDAAPQVLTAALRGAVLNRGDAGLPMLLEALRGKDIALVDAAVRTSLEMPGSAVTAALSGEVAALRPASQVLVISVLGKRGDKAALPALAAMTSNGSKAVRAATVRALVEIGGASAVPALVAFANDSAAEVAQPARNALAAMEGSAEFQALVGLLVKTASAPERQTLEGVILQMCMRNTRLAAGDVVIKSAVYGDLPNGPSADVTAKVAEMVKQGAVAVEASNANFGDSAPSITKKLRVEYTASGTARTETVNEGETLRIAGGAAPAAFVDALRAAAEGASPEAKQSLERILTSTQARAR
jgi:HEAT repeat protein